MAYSSLANFLLTGLCLISAVRCATLRPVLESGTLRCNIRNRDPCANFPDLCSTVGGTCVVKGPCKYECVCSTSGRPSGDCSPNSATGSDVIADKVTDLRPAETESLLVFSPGLFWDLNHVDSRGELIRPSQHVTLPTTTSTTTLKTTTAFTTTASTTFFTTKPTTYSTRFTTIMPTTTTSSPQITTSDDITTPNTAFTTTSTTSDFQKVITKTPGNTEMTHLGGTTVSKITTDVTTSDAVNMENASSALPPLSSPFISSLYPTPTNVKSREITPAVSSGSHTPAVSSGSPSSEIHDILEKIKTSFELLTSHILASENSNATGKSQLSDTSGQPLVETTGLTSQVDKLISKAPTDQVQRDTTDSTAQSILQEVTRSTVKV